MADNITRIKSPIKITIDDDKDTALRKQNQNNRMLWEAFNNILERLTFQEERSLLEFIKETEIDITIMTARGNRKITLNEEE